MRLVVTGGTGTFGRAFIRRALADPKYDAVISLSRDEQKAAAMVDEFGRHRPFKAFLGDVRDRLRLMHATYGADVVVHAAALKRVDVGAYSPSELIETNIHGTRNVVDAAISNHVRTVVVVSSDKAVSPTNLYGATKMCAEAYAVQANAYGYPRGTRICAVRYGNILGSRGSVVHLWRRQLAAGQPPTLTDARMTRFLMTIEQACALVEFAVGHQKGGEVFLPVLRSARILDLLAAVVQEHVNGGQSCTAPVVTGLRPGGEKLHESLLNEEELVRTRMLHSAMMYSEPDHRVLAISPSHHEWTADEPQPWDGEPCDWPYRSDDPMFSTLTVDDIVRMIASTEACR